MPERKRPTPAKRRSSNPEAKRARARRAAGERELSIRVPATEYARISELAGREDRTLSAFVRNAVREYITTRYPTAEELERRAAHPIADLRERGRIQ